MEYPYTVFDDFFMQKIYYSNAATFIFLTVDDSEESDSSRSYMLIIIFEPTPKFCPVQTADWSRA